MAESKFRPYCLAPFVNLMVEGSGEVRVCCASKDRLGQIRTGEDSIRSLRSSKAMQTFQKQMWSEGEIPESCLRCVEKEKKGLESHRIKFNRRWRKEHPSVELLKSGDSPLLEIDLSFSNTCNLDCVMCSSQYSNRWLAIEKDLNLLGAPFRGFAHHKISDKAVDELIELAPQVRRITLKGGEPLFDPQALRFLQGLSESDFHGEVLIVTNLTAWSDKTAAVLAKLPKVHLVVSIDGVGSVYEWIRGVAFETVEENLLKAFEVPSVSTVTPRLTLSAYNILGLVDYLKWMVIFSDSHPKMERDNFSQSVMNKNLTSRSLPLSWRKEVEAEFLKHPSGPDLMSSTLKNYLNMAEGSLEEKRDFLKWSKSFNTYRQCDIFDIHPKLLEL